MRSKSSKRLYKGPSACIACADEDNPPELSTEAVEQLVSHFRDLQDPRRVERCDHLLVDILVIAILAVICGANDCEALAEYGQARQDWLCTFLALPNGIPSHDTFNRVLTLLKPSEFQRGLHNWINSLVALVVGEVVAIDGKVLRRSHARSRAQQTINLGSTGGYVRYDLTSPLHNTCIVPKRAFPRDKISAFW